MGYGKLWAIHGNGASTNMHDHADIVASGGGGRNFFDIHKEERSKDARVYSTYSQGVAEHLGPSLDLHEAM